MFQASPNPHAEFLSAVLGNGQGYISIGYTAHSALGTCSYKFFEASDIDGITDYIYSLPEQSQVLFGLGRLASIPKEGRGKAEDVSTFSAIAMDIDLYSEKKAHQNLPSTLQEAIDLIKTFPLQPSILIKSGTGCHVYWLLDRDTQISNSDELKEAKQLIANFHQGVNDFFAPVEFDHTHDISRVMRMPGSVNLKDPANPLEVEILEFNPDLRYEIEDIKAVSATKSRSAKSFRLHAPQNPAVDLDFDRMVDGCNWLKKVIDSEGKIPYASWFGTGSLMSLSKDGNERFHQWSQGSPEYDYDDAQRLYEQIDPEKARRTCVSLAAMLNPSVCEKCIFFGGIQSPAELGEKVIRPIHTTGQQLPVLTAELWAAVHVKNAPPRLFASNGMLARVDERSGTIQILDESSARHVFARLGLWVNPTKDKDGWGSHAQPSLGVIRDAMATPNPPVPHLNQVVRIPVLTEHGILLESFGYDPASGIYYANDGSEKPTVNLSATQEDAIAALNWILDEVLVDFPFFNASAKAHALALALQSFVRPMIPDVTPFYLIDKPIAGTGATKLAQSLVHPYLGSSLPVKPWPGNEDERRKQITAHLLAGSNPFFYDNLEGRVDSNVLAGVLTAEIHSDRMLQRSQDLNLVNRATWIGTGNNPTFSEQITRRIVRIRLVANEVDPTSRTDFKHEDLDRFVRDHRAEFAGHILTIICGWVNEGMPKFSGKPMASYIAWSQIIGGILEYVGVPGFLADAESKAELLASNDDLAPAFIEDWLINHGGRPMSPKEIVATFSDSEVSITWDAINDGGRASKAGSLLRSLQGRTFEALVNGEVKKVRVDLKTRKYRLKEVS